MYIVSLFGGKLFLKRITMIKTFFFFSALATFCFSKFGWSSTPDVSVQLKPMTVIDSPALNDVHPLAHSWDADLYLVNFDQTQEQKVRKAVQIIKRVITSKEFKDRVLNYQFNGSRQFHDNQGLSNEQVYQRIFEGAEIMGNTSRNNMMNVELELYHQMTNTIGYTYPNTVRIWMNKKYFAKYTPVKVADNLMHEWMHKLGFTHATIWSQERDHSVPYAIGYLIEELAAKYQE